MIVESVEDSEFQAIHSQPVCELIVNLFEEAKRKGVSISSLAYKLQNVSVHTTVSPGPGVVEQTPRSGRKKGKRK